MPLEDFQIIQKIGQGSYSKVYKVLRISDTKQYAMKKVQLLQMNQHQKSNALNQVRILASIQNEYIISYKQAFFEEIDKSLYIIMEYANNGDLKKKIKQASLKKLFFQEKEIWKFTQQILTGLQALHKYNIIHCDIKSANVFLTQGKYKLGDMNVSKVSKSGFIYTQTGTPYYASPEVWKNKPYDYKSDIWSLGIVIYEMTTLQLPFQSNNIDKLFQKVMKGTYKEIPNHYSNELRSLISWCLKQQPYSRPSCFEIFYSHRFSKFLKYNETKLLKNSLSVNNFKQQKALLQTININQLYSLPSLLPKPKYQNPYVQTLKKKSEYNCQLKNTKTQQNQNEQTSKYQRKQKKIIPTSIKQQNNKHISKKILSKQKEKYESKEKYCRSPCRYENYQKKQLIIHYKQPLQRINNYKQYNKQKSTYMYNRGYQDRKPVQYIYDNKQSMHRKKSYVQKKISKSPSRQKSIYKQYISKYNNQNSPTNYYSKQYNNNMKVDYKKNNYHQKSSIYRPVSPSKKYELISRIKSSSNLQNEYEINHRNLYSSKEYRDKKMYGVSYNYQLDVLNNNQYNYNRIRYS